MLGSTFAILPFTSSSASSTEAEDRPHKLIHFVRHAEGTHNVQKDYRSRANIDAPLTDKGIRQCVALADKIKNAKESSPLWHLRESAELIVTSPLRRCIQTATLSLQPLLEKGTPMVAHEFVRETVNYNCDRRQSLEKIAAEHPHVDFDHIEHEHDDIWQRYEDRFGCDETFTKHRESGEIHVVAERGRAFFEWLREQPQKHIVICTHSAFLRCIKNFGNNKEEGPLGVPQLPEQHADLPSDISPVLEYPSDSTFAKEMRRDYENCELRSMKIVF